MSYDEIPPEHLEVTSNVNWKERGGQHTNGPEPGVTIKHLPSGITITVQTAHSQHRNRSIAMDAMVGALSSPAYRGAL